MKLSLNHSGIKLENKFDCFLLYRNIESIFFFFSNDTSNALFFYFKANSVVVHSHNLAIEKKKVSHDKINRNWVLHFIFPYYKDPSL